MTLRAIPGLDPGPSGGRRAAPRGRAATLIELVLYLTITMLVLVFTIQLVDAEQQRRNSVIVTGTLQQAIQGAQLYVATEYDNLREELFDPDDAGPTSGKQMLLVVTDIPDGFFPPTFDRDDNALTRYHDQRFALLLRGVLRSDTDSPMATITPNDIDHELVPGTLGDEIAVEYIDGTFTVDDSGTVTNDEFDIEAILLTHGDKPGDAYDGIPPNDANRIVAQSEVQTAGILMWTDSDGNILPVADGEKPSGVDNRLLAMGPNGGWTMDVMPFVELFETDPDKMYQPRASRFAAPIALSKFGVLTTAGNPAEQEDPDGLSRCADIPRDNEAYADCIAPDESALFSSLVFNAWDSDGDGRIDQFPGFAGVGGISMADVTDSQIPTRIEGLSFLGMRAPYASVEGGDIDRFSVISDVSTIVMAEPFDANLRDDGDPATVTDVAMRYSSIAGLGGISCGAGASTQMEDGRLVFDCEETQLSERMLIQSDGLTMAGASAIQNNMGVTGSLVVPRPGEADSTGTQISDGELTLRSKDGEQLSLAPTITRAGRLEADGAAAVGRLYVSTDSDSAPEDVTENAMWRLVTVTAKKGNVRVGLPDCVAGYTPDAQLVSVLPPLPYTINGRQGTGIVSVVLDGSDIQIGAMNFTVTVTYSLAGDEILASAQCIRSCTTNIFVDSEWRDRDCDITDCAMDPLWQSTASVTNPEGAVYTFRVGCRPTF